MVRILYTCALVSMFLSTGCVTPTPQDADGVEARVYSAARIGTAAYLMGRERVDMKHREALRQAYVAFTAVLYAARANGAETVDVETALAEAITAYIHDETIRPLATELVREIIVQVRAHIPAGIEGLDSWRVAVSVQRGIADVLRAAKIDPAIPVVAI